MRVQIDGDKKLYYLSKTRHIQILLMLLTRFLILLFRNNKKLILKALYLNLHGFEKANTPFIHQFILIQVFHIFDLCYEPSLKCLSLQKTSKICVEERGYIP